MHFTDFIRDPIQRLLKTQIPVKFYWDIFTPLPETYLAMQVEDLSVNNKLSWQYRNFLNNADKVFDYSTKNQEFYPSEFIPFVSENREPVENNQRRIFYGLLTPRRHAIISRLGRVEYYPQLTYDQMKMILPGSNVISIGSYSARCNDTLRSTVALNLGANLICEETEEDWYNNYLKTFGDKVGWIEY